MTPVALKTWLDLLRHDDPDLVWVVGPMQRPFISTDDLAAVTRADPSMLDGLRACDRVFIEHDAHPMGSDTVAALVEVVRLRAVDGRAA